MIFASNREILKRGNLVGERSVKEHKLDQVLESVHKFNAVRGAVFKSWSTQLGYSI